MPNKLVCRQRKGGLVPTGKSLRRNRELRQIMGRDIPDPIRLDDLFPEVPQDLPPSQQHEDIDTESLERRLAALRNDVPPARTLSSGHEPQFNSGSVMIDHPSNHLTEQPPLTLEEMDAALPDLNLRPGRRASIGGIKKRKSRKHRKHRRSKRKSKHNKKKHTRRRVNKKLKRNSRTRRR